MNVNNISTRQFIKILENNGFKYVSCNGSHKKYVRDKEICNVIIHSKQMNPFYIKNAIKKHHLVVDL